jgi:hypothetical protein
VGGLIRHAIVSRFMKSDRRAAPNFFNPRIRISCTRSQPGPRVRLSLEKAALKCDDVREVHRNSEYAGANVGHPSRLHPIIPISCNYLGFIYAALVQYLVDCFH